MPASIAGCKLETGVPPEGPDELKLAGAGVLDEAVFLDDAALLEELLTSGAAILLTALGVGETVHCHNPSALTQE